jgi:hypothetical protein
MHSIGKENVFGHHASSSSVSKNNQKKLNNMPNSVLNSKTFEKKAQCQYSSNQKLSNSRHNSSFQSAHHLQNTSQPKINTYERNKLTSKQGYNYHSAHNSEAKYLQGSVFDRLYQDSKNKQLR